jgi:hypothetical protein
MTYFSVVVLYLLFRVKQFTCDFLLQNDWMAMNKGKPGMEGYQALASHCLVHAAGTLIITLLFAPDLWWLGVVDFVVHALVDRIKGMVTYDKGWKTNDKWFWWTFGLDQEAHNLTHMVYLVIIVAHTGVTG